MPNILIVEDEEAIRRVLKKVLSEDDSKNNIFETARAFTTTIISFDSPNLFVTFKLDGGSTGWFKRETLRSGKVMLTSSLSIVAYLAGRYVKAVIA